MNSLKLVFLGLGFTGLLTACTTTYQAQPNLDTYLEQFIGQSAEQIKAKINLPALGYELKGSPVQTTNQLSYTILRPLAVPIPSRLQSVGTGGAVIAPPTSLGANSYEIDMYCQISFILQNNIAKDVQYRGRSC